MSSTIRTFKASQFPKLFASFPAITCDSTAAVSTRPLRPLLFALRLALCATIREWQDRPGNGGSVHFGQNSLLRRNNFRAGALILHDTGPHLPRIFQTLFGMPVPISEHRLLSSPPSLAFSTRNFDQTPVWTLGRSYRHSLEWHIHSAALLWGDIYIR